MEEAGAAGVCLKLQEDIKTYIEDNISDRRI